jgi:hypothetical protein
LQTQTIKNAGNFKVRPLKTIKNAGNFKVRKLKTIKNAGKTAGAVVAPSWCGCCTKLVRMLHQVGADAAPSFLNLNSKFLKTLEGQHTRPKGRGRKTNKAKASEKRA